MIIQNQHYTIQGTQDVFQAVTHNEILVLRDLKASYKWNATIPAGATHKGEYFEGYRIAGQTLEPFQSYVSNGFKRPKAKTAEHREPLSIDMLQPCEVEVVSVDLAEWGKMG